MPHIPTTLTKDISVVPFRDALAESEHSGGYDVSRWLYVPCRYEEYRYILGTRGNSPLIAVGVNPSTAAPGALDNTLKSVERIALGNGYDSFIMFNVYAQRATDPDDMETEFNPVLHSENMAAFDYVLSLSSSPAVWAAWGTVIEKRAYLANCVRDMIEIGSAHGARWYTCGSRSKKCGHPHHPLYLRKDAQLDSFDAAEYLDGLSAARRRRGHKN